MSSGNLIIGYFETVQEYIRTGNVKELKRLYKRKKDIVSLRNNYSQTALHIASIEGNVDVVKFLIDKKTDINAQDRQGWTAIFCACNSDHLEIVEILINAGASIDIKAFNGSSMLHYFVRMSSQKINPTYDKIFYTIIQSKVDINLKNQQGETPLHMASFRGKEKSIDLLLSVSANCNIKNMFGETCLHLATRSGHFSIVRKLLDNKANHTFSGKNGSIFDIAVTCNHPEITKYFEGKFPNQMNQARIMFSAKVEENSDYIAKPRFSYQFSSKFEKIVDDSISNNNNNNNEGDFPVQLRKNTIDAMAEKQPIKPLKRRTLWKNRSKKKNVLNNTSNVQPIFTDPVAANVPLKNFSSQRYEFCEVIGKGGFSQVFKALDKENNSCVAIKRMEILNTKKSIIDSSMTELNLLKRLQSDQIVKYIDFFRDRRFIYLVMEYMESSLREIVDKTEKFQEEEIVKYTIQMLIGLDYLHRRGVIHRDIKAANILINTEGIVKLADFGVAYVPESQAGLHSIIQSIKSVDIRKNAPQEKPKELLGSPYWMAPEVVLLETMSIKSDIWSLGCTLIEMINKKPPYFDLEPMAALFAISGNDPPEVPPNLSPELESFIRTCLMKNPKDRPSSRELVVHPFILKHKSILQELTESTPFKDLIFQDIEQTVSDDQIGDIIIPINQFSNATIKEENDHDEDDEFEDHYQVQYEDEEQDSNDDPNSIFDSRDSFEDSLSDSTTSHSSISKSFSHSEQNEIGSSSEDFQPYQFIYEKIGNEINNNNNNNNIIAQDDINENYENNEEFSNNNSQIELNNELKDENFNSIDQKENGSANEINSNQQEINEFDDYNYDQYSTNQCDDQDYYNQYYVPVYQLSNDNTKKDQSQTDLKNSSDSYNAANVYNYKKEVKVPEIRKKTANYNSWLEYDYT